MIGISAIKDINLWFDELDLERVKTNPKLQVPVKPSVFLFDGVCQGQFRERGIVSKYKNFILFHFILAPFAASDLSTTVPV